MSTKEYALALTKAQTEIETLRHDLELEKEVHRDTVSIANLWRERADKQLQMAEAAEAETGQVRKCLDFQMRQVELQKNWLERALFALEQLRDAAISYHDYNCHGECCATCCYMVEAVDHANDLLLEHQPIAPNNL